MKIAVAATGSGLDAPVASQFGECPCFVILDPRVGTPEAVNSPDTHNHGAGMLSAQLMVERSVKTVVTGDCGPYTARLLKAAGITLITGARGTVREAVNRLAS